MANAFIKYFLSPFADVGTVTPISNTPSVTGTVNYPNGFTPTYELNLNDDPAALPIPRPQFNQLMLDITANLKYLQDFGVPAYVAPGDGGPANYSLYSLVGFDGGDGYQVWESQLDGNTSTPGANNDWVLVSGARGNPAGTIIAFAGSVPPVGYLAAQGATVLREDYPNLFKAIVENKLCTTNSDTSLVMASTASLFVGMKIEGSGIQPNTTILSITNGTTLVMSNAATSSGTNVSIYFFRYGNDGDGTEFNLPDLRRQCIAGSGGAGSSILGTNVGQNTLDETTKIAAGNLPEHTHNVPPGFTGFPTSRASGGTGGIPAGTTVSNQPTTGNNTTGNTPINIIQPTMIQLMCIKY